jgi:uncharacterized protein (TIGR00251 family)
VLAPQIPAWLQIDGAAAVLHLHVQPGAKRTEIVGEHGEALKVRLAAPPVDGKANAELLDYLAERLGLPRAALTLKSGESSRRKRVAVMLPGALILERLLGTEPGR